MNVSYHIIWNNKRLLEIFSHKTGETKSIPTKEDMAFLDPETGKIELEGPFANTNELYAYRREYGLEDDDFIFVDKWFAKKNNKVERFLITSRN